jgi:hypothetical protein
MPHLVLPTLCAATHNHHVVHGLLNSVSFVSKGLGHHPTSLSIITGTFCTHVSVKNKGRPRPGGQVDPIRSEPGSPSDTRSTRSPSIVSQTIKGGRLGLGSQSGTAEPNITGASFYPTQKVPFLQLQHLWPKVIWHVLSVVPNGTAAVYFSAVEAIKNNYLWKFVSDTFQFSYYLRHCSTCRNEARCLPCHINISLAITKLIQLGSKYFTSSGCTEETAHFLWTSQLRHQEPNNL